MNRLSERDLQAFHARGFLEIRRPVLSPARFSRLATLFEELLQHYGPDDLNMIHIREPALLEFLLADEVLDLVEAIVGPDIGLWSSHFIVKPPHVGRITPWHEDRAYWDGRISTMDGIVTIWLAIDPTDVSNGSMGVIPGTHLRSGWNYENVDIGDNIFNIRIRPDEVDESQACYFTLDRNQCSLHDARLVHGAQVNSSPRRRAGYTMRYFPTSSHVPMDKNPGHALWLARGRDRAGNEYRNA